MPGRRELVAAGSARAVLGQVAQRRRREREDCRRPGARRAAGRAPRRRARSPSGRPRRRPGSWASARMRSTSRPAWRQISKVRALTTCAAGARCGPSRRSTTRRERPSRSEQERGGQSRRGRRRRRARRASSSGPSEEPRVAAAVELQVLARDEAGLRAAQEGAGVAELLGPAETPGGDGRARSPRTPPRP